MTVRQVPLEEIRLDGGTQPRVALNQATVDEYAEVLTAGGELPPVTVFHDGSDHWLVDGFHRLFAHRKIGAVTLMADVRQGRLRDAVLWSVGANAAHGLRRTNDDKRKAVRTLLDDAEWSQWSDRQIAEACGVSAPFVGALRRPEVAERQKEHRAASARKAVEDDAGCNPITPDPSQAVEQVTGKRPGAKPKQDAAPTKETKPTDLVGKLKARIAELEAELAESREQCEEAMSNMGVMASELEAYKRATDPEHAKKFIQQQGYVDALESQRNDLMNQCAALKREVKALRRRMGEAA